MIDATRSAPALLQLSIDGREVHVPAGTTIWQAAKSAGIDVPVLCHSESLAPVGVCRLCVVDVGERVLAPSCTRLCAAGMRVVTSSPRIEHFRRTLVQLLLSEHPVPCAKETTTADCQLEQLGRDFGLLPERSAAVAGRSVATTPIPRKPLDVSSPVIAVDHTACILCDRCIRACNDVQANHVIGRTGKGHHARIAFDLDAPMGESTCVSCGECVSACPTGALVNKPIAGPLLPVAELKSVDSVCPYCGVGCALTYHTHNDRIVYAEGRDSPVNHERLCVKGRYGWDYAQHPQRLTKPLIRRESFYPKGPLSSEVKASHPAPGARRKPGGIVDDREVLPAFREATWDEALDLVAARLMEIKQDFGPQALAGFGSAKCSNEEAYLFQKLIRAGFGNNNVDHCTRLCHASSVAALMETIGSGAVTNIFADVARADVALVTGSNAPGNHPVAATFIKNAAVRGTKLIVVDVRRNDLADFATHYLQIRPGTDVALYNGIVHVLLRDGLIDEEFIAARTEGIDQLRKLVERD